MNSKLTKFAQAAALGLALTLLACEEKKKQDGTTTEPAAAETQQPSQEAAAEVVKGSFTDTRDKKTYKTVKIGEQVWMAENLNYAAGGSCGGTVSETEKWIDEDTGDVSGEWTHYPLEYKNNANCDKYGRLYEWETAKTVCPDGWHLPSDAEWRILVEGDKEAGNKLKASSGWDDFEGKSLNGTDNYGFSALPGGNSDYSFFGDNYIEEFHNVGSFGCWWGNSKDKSASISDNFYYGEAGNVNNGNNGKCSVRCLQDKKR